MPSPVISSCAPPEVVERRSTNANELNETDHMSYLCRRRPRDQGRGGVLYLHLVQEDVAVLRELDLPGTADELLRITEKEQHCEK